MYQTVYSERPSAVAALTAVLHFDKSMLSVLRAKVIEMAFITLHVGAGTFQQVHLDGYRAVYHVWGYVEVWQTVVDAMLACKARGNLVIAVGTTSVGSLENTAMVDEDRNLLAPFFGDPYIFIFPGYRFRVIDVLITNFYLPESTLIMLVAPLPVIVIPVLLTRH